MTPTKHDDPWSQISANPSLVVGRRFDGCHALAVYWVRDGDGSPGLVFRGMDVSAVPSKPPKFRNMSIHVSCGEDGRMETRLFLRAQDERDVFLNLCLDVIGYSAQCTDSDTATISVFRRLEHWQRLLSRGGLSELSAAEARGLMGELLVLDRLALSIGMEAALSAWTAPDDHPQDFAFGSGVIEVKTRLSGSRNHVHISSLEQLESDGLPIFLVVVELAPSRADGAVSLGSLVERLRSVACAEGAACRDGLDSMLLRRGYLDHGNFDCDRYVEVGARAFAVGDGFPTILRSSVDHRIRQASYSIDISGIGDFELPLDRAIGSLVGG